MDDISKYLERNPGSVIFARYASSLIDEGRLKEAVDILRKGTRANPFYATGHAVLGDVLFRHGESDRAAESIRTALSLDPQLPGDLVYLGSHLAQDSPEEALLCLEMALRYSPSDPDITALADQIRGQFEPDLDLQLSERTEQALRDITGGGETKSSAFESEEDMLAALVSAEHEDSTPEIPSETDEYGNTDAPVSEEFKLADEEDVSNVLPEEETAGDTQDEPVDQLAGEIESIQRDTGDIDEIMTESPGAGENTEMAESAATIEAESAPAEPAATDQPMDEETPSVSSLVSDTEDSRQGETSPVAEVEPESMVAEDITDTLVSDEARVMAVDETAVEPAASTEAGPEPVADSGEDLTDDFLAYARMIEAESVPGETSTYDKLISEKFGEPDDDTGSTQKGETTPFDLDDEWLTAISGEHDALKVKEEQNPELSDDDLNRELMDYVKLFEEHADAATEPDNESPAVLSIDEAGEYNPAEFSFDDSEGDAVLTDEERQALERGEIIGDETPAQGLPVEKSVAELDSEYLSSIAGDLSVEELEELTGTGSLETMKADLEPKSGRGDDSVADTDVLSESGETEASGESGVRIGEDTSSAAGESIMDTSETGVSMSSVQNAPGKSEILSAGAESIDELSIDDLINDYMSTLENEAGVASRRKNGDAVDVPATPVPAPEIIQQVPPTGKPEHHHGAKSRDNDAASDDDEITATIAEIYVAQGLIRKAVGIYRKLVDRDPLNEAMISRLAGLQQQLDRQNEDS